MFSVACPRFALRQDRSEDFVDRKDGSTRRKSDAMRRDNGVMPSRHRLSFDLPLYNLPRLGNIAYSAADVQCAADFNDVAAIAV